MLTSDVNPRDAITLGPGARTMTVAAAAAGVAALGAAALLGSFGEFLRTYLVGLAWSLSLALGAIFFVLIQHLTGSTWSVVVRRIAEATASTVVLMAVLFIPVVAGLNVLYEWAAPGAASGLHHKAAWFGKGFFVVRAAVFFGTWILISRSFLRTSRTQDRTGDPLLTLRMQRRAPAAMILYAITVTYAAFDLFMSLDPHWYSTIFGVYYFAGSVVGIFALLVLVSYLLQRSGKLRDHVTTEHYHDLGKQLFAWVVFWAYIAFSQYMLMWYANVPEETSWYLVRQQGGWLTISLLLLAGNFVLPFVALLPRGVKRRPALLAGMAAFLLAMHWVDLYWLLVPEKGAGGHVPFSAQDVVCFAGHLCLFSAGLFHALGGGALVPERDPRLARSMAFENL